jgi:hypothetical protein
VEVEGLSQTQLPKFSYFLSNKKSLRCYMFFGQCPRYVNVERQNVGI